LKTRKRKEKRKKRRRSKPSAVAQPAQPSPRPRPLSFHPARPSNLRSGPTRVRLPQPSRRALSLLTTLVRVSASVCARRASPVSPSLSPEFLTGGASLTFLTHLPRSQFDSEAFCGTRMPRAHLNDHLHELRPRCRRTASTSSALHVNAARIRASVSTSANPFSVCSS